MSDQSVIYNAANFDDTISNPENSEKSQTIKALDISTNQLDFFKQGGLDNFYIHIVEDSQFFKALRPGKLFLTSLVKHPAFVDIRAKLSLPEDTIFHADTNGRIQALNQVHKHIWDSALGVRLRTVFERHDITNEIDQVEELEKELHTLKTQARITWGISSTSLVSVGQWLRFHEVDVPQTADQAANLLEFFNTEKAIGRSNFCEVLASPAHSRYELTAEHRSTLWKVTDQLLDGNELLINHLMNEIPWIGIKPSTIAIQPGTYDDLLWMLSQPEVRAIARQYTEALGWHDAEADIVKSIVLDRQVLLAAIMLNLRIRLEDESTEINIAGYKLYSTANVEKNWLEVRTELESHFINKVSSNGKHIDPFAVPMIVYALLTELAPAFLVEDAPASLQVGSTAWVMLNRAVMLAEFNVPGSSQLLTYAQLLKRAMIAPISHRQKLLHNASTVRPVLYWALINESIPRDSDSHFKQENINAATTQYNNYLKELSDAANTLSTPFPSRKKLALETLKSHVPDCDFLETKVLRNRTPFGEHALTLSILDAYLSNNLLNKDWWKEGEDIYTSFPNLLTLPSIKDIFHEAVDAHLVHLKEATSTVIRHALSALPQEDRGRLGVGETGVFSLRRYMPRDPFDSAPLQPTDRARFGVLITATLGNELHCYELHTLTGECKKNQSLVEAFRRSGLVDDNDDLIPKALVPDDRGKLMIDATIDLDAYFKGKPSEKVGHEFFNVDLLSILPRRTGRASDYRSPLLAFRSVAFKEIARFIASEALYVTKDSLIAAGFDKTEIEQRLEADVKWAGSIIDIIVPFKSCIEDLASGDKDRRTSGIWGCLLDGAAVLLPFIGFAGTAANLLFKAGSLGSKISSVTRLSLKFSLSLFNPVDGIPTLLGKGAVRIGRLGSSGFELATSQLRKLTGGADAYDFVRASRLNAAAEARLGLSTLEHGKFVFKDPDLLDAQDVLQRLAKGNESTLANEFSNIEIQHLLENSLSDIVLRSEGGEKLKSLLSADAADTLVKHEAQKWSLSSLYPYKDNPLELPNRIEGLLELEVKNINFMNAHQDALLKLDLGKPPYNGVLEESAFNPRGLTDNVDRAAAWIAKSSNSKNDVEGLKTLLGEYAASRQSLSDLAVVKEIHKKVLPTPSATYRGPVLHAPYPGTVSGTHLLEKHLEKLDPSSEHFNKQLFAALVGYHSFADGNGRTARLAYAISELRKGRFNALAKTTEDALSGLS
ncbi:hypothetical protein J3D54_004987 [Pseudomonas sp. GGS8]|uniref:hypothetical protein n=1 Tax=Pseudomonas sp. GGS8 TaxID=2817892 RepID=UPI00209C804D|nr:hypothetical protein [Pseudomonas sp. GGS8]MCP1445855.1 hypothetical protein [Pseudomonas sp. GGS8]